MWIYWWTRWATRWQPAEIRQVGRLWWNCTWVGSSSLLTTRTADLARIHVGPGPAPEVTVRKRCHHYPWPPPALDFRLHAEARTARQVQCNLVIHACLLQPHTKKEVMWRSLSMEWVRDVGNEPVPAWSCNLLSERGKPLSASHLQSRNPVHMDIVRSLFVCVI